MGLCSGSTLAIPFPGAMAYSYNIHAPVRTAPTTKGTTTAADAQGYVPPAHVNPNTTNPMPARNKTCPP